jgi:predicted dienelactone hydrolase
MSYFASHGWMGLAVGHVGNRLIDGNEATNRPVTHWHRRPLDISAALDAIEALHPDHLLSGKADTSIVLSTGHSRGTYTPWALAGSTYDIEEIQKRCDEHNYRDECTSEQIQRFTEGFKDSRIAAILPTAGNGHSEFFDGVEGRNNLSTAVLLMTAKDNPVGAETLFEELSLPNFTWVEIVGGCHELFNLGCGFVEDSEKFPLVTTYALAFGRRYILNDSDPTTLGILDGSIEVSPHITLKKK